MLQKNRSIRRIWISNTCIKLLLWCWLKRNIKLWACCYYNEHHVLQHNFNHHHYLLVIIVIFRKSLFSCSVYKSVWVSSLVCRVLLIDKLPCGSSVTFCLIYDCSSVSFREFFCEYDVFANMHIVCKYNPIEHFTIHFFMNECCTSIGLLIYFGRGAVLIRSEHISEKNT